jgi:hypothetical protein
MNSSNKISNKITLVTVGSTVSLSVFNCPAQAQATGTAADLLPLDAQSVTIETVPDQLKALKTSTQASIKPEATYSPDLLRTVAHNVNHDSRQDEEPDTPDIGDLIDLSFVEQFIDENGNVDLPLGLTVYEAMGQTSIGFGADFR